MSQLGTAQGAGGKARIVGYVRGHFSSLASIAVRAVSVLTGFIITYYIGHTMGPLANGQYALVAQTAMFLSIVAVGGMDLAAVRQFSAAVARRIPLARASLWRALGYALGAALLILGVLYVGGPRLFSYLFKGEAPPHALPILAVLLVARTTTRLTGAVLRSQGKHLLGQCIEALVIPGAVSLLLLVHAISGLQQLLYATGAVGICSALYGIWRTSRLTASKGPTIDVPFSALFRTSLPLWFTVVALNIADWYSLATAATTLGVYEAGLFRVAFQIGGALSFSAMGMYNVFTVRISAAVALGDTVRVAQLSRSVTRLAIVLLSPVALVLLLAADPLLALIGPEFAKAAPLLRVILVGQIIYVATGPAGLVLAMSGHERTNLLISATTTGILLVTAPIAAQHYGLFGLATLIACVPVAGNLANLLAVYRLEKINVMTGHYFGPSVSPHRIEAADAEIRAAAQSTRETGEDSSTKPTSSI